MAGGSFTDGLDVSVGDPTRASDYDSVADNTEFNREKASEEHDFDISTGTGDHKTVTPLADSTYDIGTTSKRFANLYVDNIGDAGQDMQMTGNFGFGRENAQGIVEVAKSAGDFEVYLSAWSTDNAHRGELLFQKSGSDTIGTLASTTINENLGRISAYGVDANGTAKRLAAAIDFIQGSASAISTAPGNIVFSTTPDGGSLTPIVNIHHTGRLGVGDFTSDSPISALHVKLGAVTVTQINGITLESDDSAYFQFQSPTTVSEVGVMWGDPDDHNVAGIYYDHTTDTMRFDAGATTPVSITSAGLTMADDTWIGLGAAKGRIVFDDTPAVDAVYVATGYLAVGAGDPVSVFESRLGSTSYWTPGTNNWSGVAIPTQAITSTNTNSGGYDPVYLGRAATSTGVVKTVFAMGAVGTASWSNADVATQTSDFYLVLRHNDDTLYERFRMKSTGLAIFGSYLGIGGQTPSRDLHIRGVGSTDVNLSLTLNGGTYTGQEWLIQHKTSTSNLQFTNNAGTGKFWLAQNGSVIMTATAGLYLDGGGDTYISEVAANVIEFVTAGNEYVYMTGNSINAQYATNGNGELSFNYYGYIGGVTQFRDTGIYNGKAGVMSFWDGSAGTLTHSVKVGIGIAPDANVKKLHLYESNSSATPILAQDMMVLESAESYNWISFMGAATSMQGMLFGDASRGVGNFIYDHNTDRFSWAVSSADKMWLNATGLGIGAAPGNFTLYAYTASATASPIARFENAGTAGAYVEITETAAASWDLGMDNGSSTFKVRYSGMAGTTFLSISNGGVVNISQLTASLDVQTDASSNLTSVSDARWKNDFGTIENALETVRKITPRYFRWNRSATEKFDAAHIEAQPTLAGFYSQDVYEHFPAGAPGGANTDAYGVEHWGLNNRALTALNMAAVQELDGKVETVAEKVARLENENAEQAARILELERLVA